METNTYTILEAKREDVEKKLKRYQKKAQKYGIPFSVSFCNEHFIKMVQRNEFDQLVENVYEVVDVTIESEVIKKDGYTILARLEHTDNGNIVNVFDGEMQSEWATMKAHCDHCNGNHGQKITFIVDNGADRKQVGRTCLKDYCGIDPQAVGMVNQFCGELEEYTPERYDFSTPIPMGYDTTTVLAFAIQTVHEQGYRKSEEFDSNKSMIAKHVGRGETPSSVYWEEAEKLSKAIEEMSTNEAIDALLNNVQTRIKCWYCKPSDFGYFAYAPVAYKKWLERKEEQTRRENAQKALGEKSDYVGTIGERRDFIIKDYELITSWANAYGITFLYRFIDENDNVLVWFASSEINDAIVNRIKATVKDHSERDGIKQTIITRVKTY